MTRKEAPIDPACVQALFTREDGSFQFARWGRAIAPAIIGVDDQGCQIFESAIGTVAKIAGIEVRELDPELGANLLIYLVNDWAELATAPNLLQFIPNLPDLIEALGQRGANQYRVFSVDADKAIRHCIVLLRYDGEMQQVSAQTLAVSQAVQALLMWSPEAFKTESPLALTEDGVCVVKPMHADLMRVAYDPALPGASSDPALALRIAARMTVATLDAPPDTPSDTPPE